MTKIATSKDDKNDRETWDVVESVGGEKHCMPRSGYHMISRLCWCQPYKEDGVIVHNEK